MMHASTSSGAPSPFAPSPSPSMSQRPPSSQQHHFPSFDRPPSSRGHPSTLPPPPRGNDSQESGERWNNGAGPSREGERPPQNGGATTSSRPSTASSSTSFRNPAYSLQHSQELPPRRPTSGEVGSSPAFHSSTSMPTLAPSHSSSSSSQTLSQTHSDVPRSQSSLNQYASGPTGRSGEAHPSFNYDPLLGPAPSSASSSGSASNDSSNQSPPESSGFGTSGGGLANLAAYPSSTSLSSSQVLSPLSPHVEPFSPSLTAPTGASWGVSGKASSSSLDARPPFAQGPPVPFPTSLSHRASSDLPLSAYAAAQQNLPSTSTLDRDRKTPSFALGGVPEHAPPHPASYHNTPNLSNYGPYSSDAESTYAPSSYGASMSAQGSRDGSAATLAAGAGLGLIGPSGREALLRRDIPTDRGGYVRAGYSTDTASRSTLTGSAATVAAAALVSAAADPLEEISTIFVVGFPEDMLEREFQNMFVFSTGFEAATLKVPASTVAAREMAAAAAGAGTSTTGAPKAPASSDPYGDLSGSYEDAFGNSPLDSALGSSLAAALGVTSRDPGGGPAVPVKKQIIGFAKFKTRQQALEARDVLSGKKVDAEKGCVLKAEMAKKNLHTKRGLSSDLPVAGGDRSFPLSSLDAATLGRLATANNLNPALLAELARQSAVQQQQAQAQQTQQLQPPPPFVDQQQQQRDREKERSQQSAYDAFHSVPASYPREPQREREHSAGGYARSTGSAPGLSAREYYDEPTTGPASPVLPSAAYYALPRANSERLGFGGSSRERGTSPHDYGTELPHSPSLSGIAASPPARGAAALQAAFVGNSMLQQLDDDPYRGAGPSSVPYGGGQRRGEPESAYASSPSLYQQASQGGSSSTLQTQQSRYGGNVSSTSLSTMPTSPLMAPSHSGGGLPRSQNPADMNAPKNTLYVGGLPAVLPSLTGPFSAAHLEDSLRDAFSRCPGFRRLLFRSKSNGPIVFVEFSDVFYATQALHDMYGNTLNGLVKSGIRLSYSKNPLGVRTGAPGGQYGNMSPAPNGADTFSPGPYSSSTFRSADPVFASPNPPLDFRSASIPRSPPMSLFGGREPGPSSSFSPFYE